MSYFFVFEGVDGAGKSGIIKDVAERLNNNDQISRDISITYEPGGPETKRSLGDDIREILLSPDNDMTDEAEALLFMADRADHIKKYVKPHLEEGNIVLSDRFWESSLVYQAMRKNTIKPEMLYRFQVTLGNDIFPDMTFLIISQKPHSLDNDRIDQETLSHRSDMIEMYRGLKNFSLIDYPLIEVDTTKKNWEKYIDNITSEIINVISEL